ncbi:trifunctional transcriptional regulator/proline dehydrogenase/L-glutamate gamma-semialdehyde dehydrogenase [Methylopila sp. Yamaguchi]|uniref:trifunctional transcriptional regulator/proline dehydrogenase/L-glutamate gamma-semialdehyde dehydrogenase n=1 Tax=Methylopila sp. Yamaguchi TaxID=1437817 RepID=UPI000CA7CE82|nr:trifunctional transcriptional regulator/proline dehydrogenase/L-glutamate gamma-semialdehyde dehydrogenase [Methylopila sp. Yamaguchi]GBD48875.1 delta-1-pyrroline-5-carboxylate dehydrogenase [Methylopila sp. Yamaguchi]
MAGTITTETPAPAEGDARPVAAFASGPWPLTPLRAAVNRNVRLPETQCLPPLLAAAALPAPQAAAAQRLARTLVEALRAKGPGGGVAGLVQEYDLSSPEGVALMCLAEALLRIPDAATRDALIRDKIAPGDWRAHLGHSPSLFVNAATWGLVVTGRLAAPSTEEGLGSALTRLVARGGEPPIRRGVDLAMRMMGERYVTGETIERALANSRRMEAHGFRYSFDMLGEAAMTAADADRYFADYREAIDAIGAASGGRGVYDGPGVSIKLSALHPRYARSQRDRALSELLPRVQELAARARGFDVGLNIDAEEADRLDLSLDVLERLAADPALQGWDGLGFVVQAYQKRAPFVLDLVIDLARRSGRRLMVRLVKGAYWDSEIKRAQVDGLDDFPVFTRKVHTDVSYLACAAKLLAARDAVFPQFATHNAQTLAAIHAMAGPEFRVGDYEFQCLHGMGEPLYEEVVGPDKLGRPCRIYAPVGAHETLLAYLVRRLLENGANSSFVHRVADPETPVDALIADPVAEARRISPLGAPHPAIRPPRQLFPDRLSSAGLDLADERVLAELSAALSADAERRWRAAPLLASGEAEGIGAPVTNPADRRDIVGHVVEADAYAVERALVEAERAAAAWARTSGSGRAARLVRAAELLESRRDALMGLLIREAGKTAANAVSEIREAADFLRYYGGQARAFDPATHVPCGPVACISPWNFPLAIFLGQVAAALAAGNVVLAKPAEETPLVAAEAVRILREAGVPAAAVQLLPGRGEVGAALVGDPRVRGVLFTGSTAVATSIARTLAERLNPEGAPVPLVAETGGQNALVADSSALLEQLTADVLASAFDSAGQRCSAARLLCLQEDIADRALAMLKGAMAELRVGPPDRLATDVGPVISAEARERIEAHVSEMRAAGRPVHRLELPHACARGDFVAPTLIELDDVGALTEEVFGPVLHVVRFAPGGLAQTIEAVNATGYALTFGVHTRIDERAAEAAALSAAGNVYVNRNIVGAVVGVQPFGGHGLSGTGPKAGGPLSLRRLLAACPKGTGLPKGAPDPAATAYATWLRDIGQDAAAAEVEDAIARSPLGVEIEHPGPVGERNVYSLKGRGDVLCAGPDERAQLVQIGAALAAGARAIILKPRPSGLPASLAVRIVSDASLNAVFAALFDGDGDALAELNRALSKRPGPIVQVHVPRLDPTTGWRAYSTEFLLAERSLSVNTAAAGGNASLMALA